MISIYEFKYECNILIARETSQKRMQESDKIYLHLLNRICQIRKIIVLISRDIDLIILRANR